MSTAPNTDEQSVESHTNLTIAARYRISNPRDFEIRPLFGEVKGSHLESPDSAMINVVANVDQGSAFGMVYPDYIGIDGINKPVAPPTGREVVKLDADDEMEAQVCGGGVMKFFRKIMCGGADFGD